jgi:hypothetical protein
MGKLEADPAQMRASDDHPGVGPITALAFVLVLGRPQR